MRCQRRQLLRRACGLDAKEEFRRSNVDHSLVYSFVGARDKVKSGIEGFLEQTQIDELIVTGHIFDHQARLRSLEIAADILKGLVKS